MSGAASRPAKGTTSGAERLRDALDLLAGKRVFFVVGVPKSGTTWVQAILDAHPQSLCKGEAHIAGLLRPALAGALDRYNKEAPKRLDPVHRAPRFETADLDATAAAATALVLARWAAESGKPDLRAVGEKTPDHVHAMGQLDALFPDARFLHIVRDPRDGAVSGWAFNMRHAPDRAVEQFGGFEAYAVKYGQVWAAAMAKAEAFSATAGDRYRAVRYEDLLDDPAAGIAAMLRFLELDAAPEAVEACRAATDFAALSGGRKAGEEDAGSFYRKGVAGDWRSRMPAELANRVVEAAGPAFARMGYQMGYTT